MAIGSPSGDRPLKPHRWTVGAKERLEMNDAFPRSVAEPDMVDGLTRFEDAM